MASWCSHKVGFYSTPLDDVDLLKCQTTENILGTWEWRISRTTILSGTVSKENTAWFFMVFPQTKNHSKTLEAFKHILCSMSLFVKAHTPTPTLKFITGNFSTSTLRVRNLMQHLHFHIYGYPWPIGEPQQHPPGRVKETWAIEPSWHRESSLALIEQVLICGMLREILK